MSRSIVELLQINIEKLLQYGVQTGLIEGWDVVQIRNSFLELFAINEPYGEEVQYEDVDDFHVILDNLIDYAAERGIISKNTVTQRDRFGSKIMGLLTPRQSEVVRRFLAIRETSAIEEATDFYYAFSKATNYIREERIKKDIVWVTETEYGNLKVSINLSKPEKDPKEIARLKSLKKTGYPKCMLCLENVGYTGRLDHPGRQNHRVIPITLEGEQWFLQYSPYSYYNEHCIVISEKHKPMNIDLQALLRMVDFVEQFPHYFLGANAGLPIVGGSILNHDHYQGGRATFPIEFAKVDLRLSCSKYPDIEISIPKWAMSCIRFRGSDKVELIELATHIMDKWKEYSEPGVNILAYTQKDGQVVPHNAVTPIVRKKGEFFEIDLVLRNNRTSEEYPDGIFHPHKDLHHIKKENIGVIEVMGLAILPGRLDLELQQIKEILTGEIPFLTEEIQKRDHLLNKHLIWIEELIAKYGSPLSREKADKIIQDEVGFKYLATILDASVFKKDQQGREAFMNFLHSCGFSNHQNQRDKISMV